MENQNRCPECEHYCSNQAYACPICGHPFRNPDGSKAVEEYKYQTIYIKAFKDNNKLEEELEKYQREGWIILKTGTYSFWHIIHPTYFVHMKKKLDNVLQQIKCPKCGSECSSQDDFCKKCGSPLKNIADGISSSIVKTEDEYEYKEVSYKILIVNRMHITDYLNAWTRDGWDILENRCELVPGRPFSEIYTIKMRKKIN